jgi:hypothetical protein
MDVPVWNVQAHSYHKPLSNACLSKADLLVHAKTNANIYLQNSGNSNIRNLPNMIPYCTGEWALK